jgi:hypothetical protein
MIESLNLHRSSLRPSVADQRQLPANALSERGKVLDHHCRSKKSSLFSPPKSLPQTYRATFRENRPIFLDSPQQLIFTAGTEMPRDARLVGIPRLRMFLAESSGWAMRVLFQAFARCDRNADASGDPLPIAVPAFGKRHPQCATAAQMRRH